MKRFILAVIALLAGAVCAPGQSYTTVTATVTDNSSAATPYALGSYSVVLINNSGQQPLFGGNPNFQQNFTGQQLSSTGVLSIVLPSVTVMTPGGMQWQFRICANPQQIASVFPPVALPCFNYTSTGTLISGTSVDLSAQIKAVAATIPLVGGASSSGFPVTSPQTVNSGGSITATGTGTITSTAVTNAPVPSSAYTFYPATSSNCLTYSASGTNYCAVNNQTGAVTTSTDIRAFWDTIVAASPNGGHFLFKNGTYNCNTLDQESTGGFTNFYCIGIPGGGSSQYAQWILEGEVAPPIIDQFDSTPAQTNGVLFNLTSTAISSVAANSKIMIIWARPDTVNGVGAMVFEKNFGMRVPTNQRGCETASDLTQALSVDYDNVFQDTAVTETSIAFPVQASCVAWGGVDPGGLIGLTTTSSVKQENWLRRSFSQGADVGLDIRSEHTIIEHSYAIRGNHCIDYGVRGTLITHSSVWIAAGCGETARALTLGANMGLGSALTILGFDLEDAASGISPAFVPVYHVLETNPNNSNGLISYSDSLQGTVVQGIPNLFDGGGGGGFSVLQATSQHNIARLPMSDTFTRANAGTLGPGWVTTPLSTGGGGLKILSNTAQPIATGNSFGAMAFVGQIPNNDQIAKVTISALDVSANSNVQILTNMSISADTEYGYYCSNAAATGSGIFKRVATVQTLIQSQTSVSGCAAGDIIELRRVQSGNNVILYAYHNGVLDKNFTNPATDVGSVISGGYPGLLVKQSATGLVSTTNFIGGSPPTIHGTDSQWATDTYATTYNTLTNCAVNSVSPAACGSAASGVFAVPTTTTTYTVNTTAITANSRVMLQDITDNTGIPSAPTCTALATFGDGQVSARVVGTSFTISLPSTAGVTCFNYWIVN